MDQKTQSAYSANAQSYSDDWLAQPEPSDMYEIFNKFFNKDAATADIGCGNGRDANWLSKNGFKVEGFDYSEDLVKIASKLYPHIKFSQAAFPELAEIKSQFDNVLCETVIMHLPKEQIIPAVQSLKRILKVGGVLYLSWRVTEGDDARHADGRLYSAFDPSFVLQEFDKKDILHFEDKISASSGKRVCRLVYKRPSS